MEYLTKPFSPAAGNRWQKPARARINHSSKPRHLHPPFGISPQPLLLAASPRALLCAHPINVPHLLPRHPPPLLPGVLRVPVLLGPHPELSPVGMLQQAGVSQVLAPLRAGKCDCKRQIRVDQQQHPAACPASGPPLERLHPISRVGPRGETHSLQNADCVVGKKK